MILRKDHKWVSANVHWIQRRILTMTEDQKSSAKKIRKTKRKSADEYEKKFWSINSKASHRKKFESLLSTVLYNFHEIV